MVDPGLVPCVRSASQGGSIVIARAASRIARTAEPVRWRSNTARPTTASP
ncbi:hypothetical protein [Streptosporangium sp. LJ11]